MFRRNQLVILWDACLCWAGYWDQNKCEKSSVGWQCRQHRTSEPWYACGYKADLRDAQTNGTHCRRAEQCTGQGCGEQRPVLSIPVRIRGMHKRYCLWFVRTGESGTLKRSGLLMPSWEDLELSGPRTSDASFPHPSIFCRPAPYCRYKAEGYWGQKLATGTDKNREMPKSILEEREWYAKHNHWKCWREHGEDRRQYACRQCDL